MKVAIYGYGVYGKRTAESFLKYWGGRFQVRKIYDREKSGEADEFWDLTVSDPSEIFQDYKDGWFEKIIVCISNKLIREEVEKGIEEKGVPLFFTGAMEDVADIDEFDCEGDASIHIRQEGYRLRVCKEMLGAPVDHYRGSDILFFKEDGKILRNFEDQYGTYDVSLLLRYPFRLKDPIPEKIFMQGEYCALTRRYSPNYWHFSFENMDKVYLLEKAGYRGKYIMARSDSNLQLMDLMGVDRDRILFIDDLALKKVYVFERFIFIGPETGNRDARTKVLSNYAKEVQKNLVKDPSYPKELYVKRIGTRKMLNGDEITEKYGLVPFIPEEHSVLEQITYFYNADLILSPHGANSTNCLYMREGTTFIEVFSDRWQNDINGAVCRENKVDHILLTGKGLEDGLPDGMYTDFFGPADEIGEAISKARGVVS
ncbi:MAG: glycosyltransferase family 61 protein [Oscillospiraceae bacterium]|nr:glycosyltransferase family 61 protein [Oscillospiraceae bacterium]